MGSADLRRHVRPDQGVTARRAEVVSLHHSIMIMNIIKMLGKAAQLPRAGQVWSASPGSPPMKSGRSPGPSAQGCVSGRRWPPATSEVVAVGRHPPGCRPAGHRRA
ncbi:hypothetical protein RA210_U10456 [Rubrivivax sp. A210]|nr:hypothetical protein RA210_U10456 [Rubrivivax sp. A210]